MKYLNNNIWLSAIISVALILPFTEKKLSDLNQISKIYLKEWSFQESVFSKKAEFKKQEQLKYKNKVEQQIRKIASKYQTNVDKGKLKLVSEYIFEYSQKYGYDPFFLTALIITESSFNNLAQSYQGALGLMQILPATGLALAFETQTTWKGKRTLYDPKINIALGAFYLNKLLKQFQDLSLALEAYNHGPTQLRQFLLRGIRPKKYSNQVYKNYKMIKTWFI